MCLDRVYEFLELQWVQTDGYHIWVKFTLLSFPFFGQFSIQLQITTQCPLQQRSK